MKNCAIMIWIMAVCGPSLLLAESADKAFSATPDARNHWEEDALNFSYRGQENGEAAFKIEARPPTESPPPITTGWPDVRFSLPATVQPSIVSMEPRLFREFNDQGETNLSIGFKLDGVGWINERQSGKGCVIEPNFDHSLLSRLTDGTGLTYDDRGNCTARTLVCAFDAMGRIMTRRSRIAQVNRTIAPPALSRIGYYWVSYDFAGSSTSKCSLLRHPLGECASDAYSEALAELYRAYGNPEWDELAGQLRSAKLVLRANSDSFVVGSEKLRTQALSDGVMIYVKTEGLPPGVYHDAVLQAPGLSIRSGQFSLDISPPVAFASLGIGAGLIFVFRWRRLARGYLSDLCQELIFENRFLRSKAESFQTLFAEIMSRAHPGDFMPCRPWGKFGDRKNDGYLLSERTLFQVYAPNEIKVAKAIEKIEEDFTQALPFWREYFDTWVFVHNSVGGLSPDVIAKLLELGRRHPEIKIRQWGIVELGLRFQRASKEDRHETIRNFMRLRLT